MSKRINIIGGGATALMFACHIDTSKYTVHLYEKEKTLGRKLMVAGKGGFNLTHGESISEMIPKYSTSFLDKSLLHFTNIHLIEWLKENGISTYKGSSGRIFPTKGIKPSEVLLRVIKLINEKHINIHFNSSWVGYNENQIKIEHDNSVDTVKWTSLFPDKIKINPFQPSNCGYIVNWDSSFREFYNGKPIKNIKVSIDDVYKKGELLITKKGLEGGAIYALSPQIRKSLTLFASALINIDLKPNITEKQLIKSLKLKKRNQSWKDFLTKIIKLDKTQYALFFHHTSKEIYLSDDKLINAIKALKISIIGSSAIDEAISTVGGVCTDELNTNFELKQLKNHYVIGEMIDWDAPTGGYLLQACFSMGVSLANYFNKKDR